MQNKNDENTRLCEKCGRYHGFNDDSFRLCPTCMGFAIASSKQMNLELDAWIDEFGSQHGKRTQEET